MEGKQKCNKCKQWLDLDEFYDHKANRSGKRYTCKTCGYLPTKRVGAHKLLERDKCRPLHPAFSQLTYNVKGIGK